jgi:hypothetical protein
VISPVIVDALQSLRSATRGPRSLTKLIIHTAERTRFIEPRSIGPYRCIDVHVPKQLAQSQEILRAPSKPIGNIKGAWGTARPRAAKILKGETEDTNTDKANTEEAKAKDEITSLACRFYDLQHTAVSRMLNAGTPIAKVAKIVGWSTSTMVLKAKRYGHFSLNDLRGAVESISGTGIEAEPSAFSRCRKKAQKLIALTNRFYGGRGRNRTYNLSVKSRMLCQLSYASRYSG